MNKMKIFEERWRFGFELHDEIYPLAEALLNINRRVQRGEDVGITEEQAAESPLLCFESQLLDDLLRREIEKEEETEDEDPFAFDEEQIPVTLKALFSNEQRFAEVLHTSQKRKEKASIRKAKRRRIQKDSEE